MEFEKGIVGLPNDNMGMNSKKPYLENKTRKVKVPYLLDQESALLQSKFFDYLFGQVSKKRFHIYVDNIDKKICSYTNKDKPEDIVSGYYLRCRMGKAGAEICEADVITHYKTKLEPGLVLKNYIEIPEERIEKSKIHYDEAIEDQWVIMDLINGIFFEGKLKNNFFTDAKDMNIYDDCLKQSILKSRNILANWFWRGEQNQLVKILDDVSLALIKNSILNDETFAAQRKFNLRWSLLEYLDDQEVGVHMSEIRNQLREHINVAKDVEWDFISDEEYSYAVGQAVSYLLHLSKANNKTESYVNPFFNAKNSKVIKQRLLRMYTKYNYQIIHINGGRNAQLLSHVMEYEPKEIKHELIMAGFTAPSLMYEKKTDDEDNE
jgi:CRISPR-associated protein Csh1